MTHEEFLKAVKPYKNCFIKQAADPNSALARRRFPRPEDDNEVTDPFLRDASVILESKAIRRQCDKTQVTSLLPHAHIRNRMSHVLEVVGISMRLANIFGLNGHLVNAISMGHDVGHMPFGHQGEDWLSQKLNCKFTHEVHGVNICQHFERKGKGLNETWATYDGRYRHSGKNVSPTMTFEAWLVRYADKIAYIFADYNDLIRLHAEVIMPIRLIELVESFGKSQRERVATVEAALIRESAEKGRVSFEDCDEAKRFQELYKLMNTVYPRVTQQNVDEVLGPIWDEITRTGIGDPGLLITFLTDKEVCYLRDFRSLNISHFNNTGMMELVPYIKEKKIDFCSPDLDW